MQPREEYNTILEDIKTFSGRMFDKHGNLPHVGRRPQVSDVEIIALSTWQAVKRCESESEFFRHLQDWMPELAQSLGTRRNYNGRRRFLWLVTEDIRRRMAVKTDEGEPAVYLVDSMPMPSCRNARARRCRVTMEDEDAASDYGYCAAQKAYYFGRKLHALCSPTGVIHSYDLSKASVHDLHYLKDVREMFENCVIIGDKGYISKEVRVDLFNYARIELVVPYRCNQKDYVPQPHEFRRLRKRIETDFSQLIEVMEIRCNYAKRLPGYFMRVCSKITAFTLLQYENRKAGRPIGHIKSCPLIA